MKALTLVAPSTFEFGDAPAPQPQQGEVLVDIKACGICGSDLHGMDGRSGRRIPPIIMGHEAAGEISAVGEGVTDWKVGDRVTFDSTEYCGHCPDCKAGNVNLCKNRKVLGVSCGDYRRHGCFADQVALPQHILYRLPDGLAYEKAAFAEPVSIALHAVNLAPKPNAHSPALTTRQEMAVVVGAGLIGLLVLQALKARGWNKVYAVDLDDSRLALAKQLGAEDAFNAKEEGLAAKLRELGGGDGVDASFEVVGAAAPVDLAIAVCARAARWCWWATSSQMCLPAPGSGDPPDHAAWLLRLRRGVSRGDRAHRRRHHPGTAPSQRGGPAQRGRRLVPQGRAAGQRPAQGGADAGRLIDQLAVGGWECACGFECNLCTSARSSSVSLSLNSGRP
nr:alcohol dehydrogenase catalytic domain-containing protein [Verrucomicrobium spinosum]